MLSNFKQSNFIVYELQLPYCTVCTPVEGLNDAWHTPVTCEESSDDTYSLFFCSNKAPLMSPPSQSIGVKSRLNSSVFRVVKSGTETTPKIKPGEGMASRGTMTITLDDFEGDPGPINFSEKGTFFGKLKARNVLDGKKIISHYYTIVDNFAAPQLISTSTHYIESSNLTGGQMKISCKDALKDLEEFSQKFPIPTEVQITADIDDTTLKIPVSDVTPFTAGEVVIIDKELMVIDTVNTNDLTVLTRGATYLAPDGNIIYKTDKAAHSNESDIQICYSMKKTFLSDVLKDIFDAVGLSQYVNYTQWDDEIREWNSNAFLYGVFHEPKSADDLINQLLSNYMVDMWLDPTSQLTVVSATTTWKQSIRTISEDTDLTDLKTSSKANTRFSRAYIYNRKDYQAENDDTTNYSQLTLHKDTATESSDFYGSVKVKEFDPSNFITPGSAEILVSRYVQRYSKTPEELTFKMEERKLAGTNLGDIVDIVTRDSQTPSGEFLQSRVRAQLISIKPNLNEVGRVYNVTALSYVPLIASGGGGLTIFISGSVFDLNLYARAGAPPDAIDITFVFDGATVGSSIQATPAIRAGGFAAGSNVKLIFTNNCKISAIGGDGGYAYMAQEANIIGSLGNGVKGGTVYQSDGITSELYLNYGVVDSYDTSCELYAPGGGGGAAMATPSTSGVIIGLNFAAASGGGGNGIPSGKGGEIINVEGSKGGVPPSGRVVNQGFDGDFKNAGAGVNAHAVDGSFTQDANSGDGGASANGFIGNATSTGGVPFTLVTPPGLSGSSIKGAGVTVYNLAADASKFTEGNSDPFTLIDS